MLSTRTGSLGLASLISFKASNPLRPGMVMSSTTVSQFSLRMRSSASRALLASPKSAFLNSSARICLRPRRTTAWSSAIRIRIIKCCWLLPTRRAEGAAQRSSLAAASDDGQFAVEHPGPLAGLTRSFLHAVTGPLDRDAHPHRGALALPADDVDFSVEHGGPFPHADQSERPRAREFAAGHAAPVVLHLEDQFV